MNKENNKKLLFIVNVDWFFISHRLPVALAAQEEGYEVHVATGITDRLNDLVSMNFFVHPLKLGRGDTSLWSSVALSLSIFRVMRLINPDIVHLVTIKPVLLGGLAARFAKVPAVVAAVSGLGFVFVAEGVKAKIRKFIIGVLYRMALGHKNIKVIFQNPDDRESVLTLSRINDKKTAVIRGSGVDLRKYQVSQHQNRGAPIVMLAARLLRSKGIYEFVQAAALIKGRNQSSPSPRFVLVGDIDSENPASLSRKDIDDIKDEAIVEVWGQRDDMPSVLSMATIIVLPSYREGLPKVLSEAAACGKAVITTDVPGCRDAIVPNLTGLLVPVKDSSSLSHAIVSLIDDPSRCKEMGRAGRQFAERHLDVRAVVHQHLDVYKELLAGIKA